MIKKTIPYTDFDGNPRVEDFWFNLTKAELMELGLSVDGGYDKYMEQLMNSTKVGEAIEVFKKVLLTAYGRKSLDGRKFEKSPEITADFVATQAYSDLYIELATDPAPLFTGAAGAGGCAGRKRDHKDLQGALLGERLLRRPERADKGDDLVQPCTARSFVKRSALLYFCSRALQFTKNKAEGRLRIWKCRTG